MTSDSLVHGASLPGSLDFTELARIATGGHDPYPYQARLAEDGLPDLLSVPTGSGKTYAVVLPWVFRRLYHQDVEIRGVTPHWLVYVLPMRVLADQVLDVVKVSLRRLGLEDRVGVHRVVGGEGKLDAEWRRRPERDSIFVGTLDMITSRQLNRGYGSGRRSWPIDFGLFNNGCHFVFDEIQLMGPALPTSRQLHGLRQRLGTAMPCRATWMSATIDETSLGTIDAPPISSTVTLSDADHSSGLAARLGATRRIEELDVADPAKPWPTIAEALAERHRPGTLTLAVLNTVDSARSLHRELNKSNPEAELVLLHSRFRPADRSAAVSAGLAPISADGPGRIVVSTQVVEAGVDISASTLVTEAAPWPSVVQRAGRCNRDGRDARASFLWYAPRQSAPYPEPDVAAAVDELRSLGGESVTSSDLGSRGVPTTREIHPVLRLVDVLGVWDSLPDLSGNDLDVSRFIRDSDDLDVEVAWREISDHQHPVLDVPGASERCPVPVAELRRFLRQKGRRAWIPDLLDETWQPLSDRDVRPGLVVVLDRQGGGYTTDAGWDPTSRKPVPVVETAPDAVDAEETIDSDTLSYSRWVTLEQHLRDTEDEVRRLTALLNPHGCHPSILEAAAIAGRLHDIGKAHPSFQEMLVATEDEAARPSRLAEGPWAKSKKGRGSLNKRRYFRHELAGALALLDGAGEALHGSAEADLVRYLVAAHHGIVRLGFRPLPNERPLPDGTPVALGVHSGETLPSVSVPGGVLPESRLDLSVMSVGDSGRGPSWSSRTLKLRDRPDLGPFRLGFLEALVRLADWAVSASYEVEGNA